MFREKIALLTITLCLAFLSTQATAQIKLNPNHSNQNYDLSKNVLLLPDPKSEFTVRDIVRKYRDGDIKQKNINNHISLNSNPQWVIIPIENTTNTHTWQFDFGALSNGRTGILEQLLIYESNQKTIFFNGLSTDSNSSNLIHHNQFINVTIPSGNKSLFILYIYPTDYKQTTIPLKLISSEEQNPNHSKLSQFIIQYTPTIIIVSILIIGVGFLITYATGFIPIIAYYIGTLFWFQFAEIQLMPSIIGLSIIAPMTPIITSLLISIACIFTVPVRYSHTALRFLLLFFVMVGILSILTFTLFDQINIQEKYTASFIISTLTLMVCVFFLLRNTSPHLKKSNRLLSFWIGSALISQIIVFLESVGFMPHNFYFSQADKIALYFQAIIVFIGIVISIKMEHHRKLENHIRQNQKTTSILNAQKTKESSDHSRLLRVIEREREIMEELRARESERTEEMRNAKVVADEANQAKSAFLAVVSHEIRTPMTGIMGMVRMLEDTSLSDEQRDYITTIGDSGQAMLALLNDILDFSKIENGSMDLENIEFDLHRVLNSVVMLMKGHADQKKLQLILNIDKEIPKSIHGDPTRLRQIMLNLVGNALKFTSKGYISITANYIDGDTTKNLHNIKFEVSDTGLGISKEAQERLFTPFAQADNTISRKYGGTGLGLTICKTLVEAMGGKITLNSREGAGSTFSFSLPFTSDHQISTGKQKTKTPVTIVTNKKFLIVDDNEINRKVLVGFLEKNNHECASVESGQQALKVLNDTNDFDALFLDIEMPGMTGIDLAGHILENDYTMHIPMIAVTGNVSKNDISRYYNAGFKSHIAKPIEPDVLDKVIDDIINHKGANQSMELSDEKIKITPSTKQKNKKTNKVAVGKTLDEIMLKGLKEGLGSKQTSDLIDELFIKADEIVGQLNDLKETKDMDSARMRAHELKGMAANFGLKALSDKSNEIEQICKDSERQFDDIIPHIEDLSTLVERSKYAVKQFLEN